MNAFLNRKLLIATAHQKERAIAPILEQELKVECFVPAKLNTDSLGTFSGEIARTGDVLSTLRAKCILAMKENPVDLVLASEGSFGAHPSSPFLPANYEMVLLKDVQNNTEYSGSYWTPNTNFSASEIKHEEAMEQFMEQIGFPSHGLILRKDAQSYHPIFKGITSVDSLWEHFYYLKKHFDSVYAETDMRALYNPKRMQAIAHATENLIENIRSLCPQCAAPGFSIVKMESGLPLYALRSCSVCTFEQKDFYPLDKKVEDPQFCDYCNP
jgi:hypothetical protein